MPPADDGQLPLVPVLERPPWTPGEITRDGPRGVLAHLNRDRADSRKRSESRVSNRSGVAEDKDLRMARDRAIGFHEDSARVIQWHSERASKGAGNIARSPHDGLGGNGPAACHDISRVDVGDQRFLAHFDTEPPKLVLGALGKLLRITWEDARPALEQHYGRLPRVDMAEVLPERVAADFG